jgi:hypothetical protein
MLANSAGHVPYAEAEASSDYGAACDRLADDPAIDPLPARLDD